MVTIWTVTNSKYSYNEFGNWKRHVYRDGCRNVYCGRNLSIFYDQPNEWSLDMFIDADNREGICKDCLRAMIRERIIAPRGRKMVN